MATEVTGPRADESLTFDPIEKYDKTIAAVDTLSSSTGGELYVVDTLNAVHESPKTSGLGAALGSTGSRRRLSSKGNDLQLLDTNLNKRKITNVGTRVTPIGSRKSTVTKNFVSPTNKTSKRVLVPESTFRFAWTWVMVVILLWFSIVVPLRFVFFNDAGTNPISKMYMLIVDIVFDVTAIIDIVLRFRFFAFYEDSILIDDPDVITKRYLSGWFAIDLLTTLPIATITRLIVGLGSNVFDVIKVLRVLRAGSYYADVAAFLTSRKIFVSAALNRLFLILLTLVIILNLFGCLFFVQSGGTAISWRTEYANASDWKENAISAFYYVAQTLFTVGYGDIPPLSDSDMICTCFMLIAGALNVAIVMGNITSLFVNIDATSNMFRNTTEDVEAYMSHRDLPPTLREQVRRFYESLWAQNKGRIEDDILAELPTDLRRDIMTVSRSAMFEIPYFADKDPNIIEAFRNKLSLHAYSQADVIYRKGMPLAELWIVATGEVHIMGADNRTIVERLKEGDPYGFHSLFDVTAFVSKNSLRAGSYVEIYVLSRLAINELYRHEFRSQKNMFDVAKDDPIYLSLKDEFEGLQEKWSSAEESKKKSSKMNMTAMDVESFVIKWWIIKPHGKFKVTWDAIMILTVMYFTIITFFRLTLASKANFQGTMWVDLVLSFLILYDVVVVEALSTMVDKKGESTRSRSDSFGFEGQESICSAVARHWKDGGSRTGILDAICLIFTVAAIISAVTAPNTIAYALLLMPNLLQIRKMSPKLTAVRDHLEAKEIRVGQSSLFAAKLLFNAFCIIHWFSCLWILIKPMGPNDYDIAGKYVESLYFVIVTIATVGYGDIHADDFASHLYMSIVMLLGCTMYAGVMSFASSLFQSAVLNEYNLEHQETVIQFYMVDRLVSKGLQERVHDYFKHRWATSGNVNEYVILSMVNGVRQMPKNYLPEGLRDAIIFHITKPLLLKSNLFKKAQPELLMQLARELKHSTHCPGDIIVSNNHKRFIMIESGEADMLSSEKNQVLKTFRDGDSFGEICLLDKKREILRLRAKTFTEVWYLYLYDYNRVKSVYGEVYFEELKEAMEVILNDEKSAANLAKNLTSKKLQKSMGDTEVVASRGPKRWSVKSNIFYFWNLLTLALLLYQVIAFPYRLAFMRFQKVNLLFIVDYLSDILFLVDIFLRYFKFEYEDASGVFTDHDDIKAVYRKKWLIWDILCILPFDAVIAPILAAVKIPVDGSLLQLCRLNRLIRVIRLAPQIAVFQSKISSRRKNTWIVFKLAATLLLAAHWAGSMFYLIAKLNTSAQNNWLGCPGWAVGEEQNEYIVSLYWGVATLGTIGYGDFYAVSLLERIFTIFMILVGGFIYAITVSNLDEIVAQADITSVLFQDKMEELKAYLSYRKLDSGLQYRVITHLLELWIHQKGCEENKILGFVPLTLRQNIVEEFCKSMIDKLPIIKGWKSKAKIFEALQAETFLSGEHIYDKGEVASRCYFITYGSADALSEDGATVYSTYTTGYAFGESAFLLGEQYECSVRATSRMNCFILTTEALNNILEEDEDLRNEYKLQLAENTDTIRKQGGIAKFQRNMSSRKIGKVMVEEKDTAQKERTLIVLPDSTARRVWDAVHLVVVIYNLVVIPFRIGFFTGVNYPPNVATDLIYWLNMIADILCWIDMFMSLFFFARYDSGVLLTTHREIIVSYVKNSLLFDMISLVPADAIVVILLKPAPVVVITLIRLPRILRFVKLNVYAGSIKTALEERMIYINSSYRQLMRILFLILLSCHVIACIRALILHLEHPIQHSIFHFYVESIYWTIYTVTTTGYGNIPVVSTYDKLWAMVAMFFGAFLCDAGITATMSNLIASIDEADAISKRSRACAFKYLSQWPDLGPKLVSQIHTYFDYANTVQNDINETSILVNLPRQFIPEILNHVALRQLEVSSIPLIKTFNAGMIRTLLMEMRPKLFLPDNIILKANTVPKHFLLIVKGNVEVLSKEEDLEMDLPAGFQGGNGSGSFISSPSAVRGRIINKGAIGGARLGMRSSHTYRSMSVVETYCIRLSSYMEIVGSASAVGGLYNEFSELLADPVGVKFFIAYSESQHSSENIKFYMAVEEYKTLTDESPSMIKRAKEIYDEYLHDTAPNQININSKNRTGIDEVVAYGSITCFDDAKAEIFLLMKKDTLPRFIQSEQFFQLVEEKERKRRASKFSLNSSTTPKSSRDLDSMSPKGRSESKDEGGMLKSFSFMRRKESIETKGKS